MDRAGRVFSVSSHAGRDRGQSNGLQRRVCPGRLCSFACSA